MRFLVTAGPTRQYIDAIRYISNPSSGRMGYAAAVAAVEGGHAATLVAGPTSLPDPEGVQVVHVTTTRELRDAVMDRIEDADVLIAAAAPCDFRPAERQTHKIKKGDQELVLRLVPTADLLYEAGQSKGRRVLIGFALEVQNARANALAKLKRKCLDAVVLNSPASFEAEEASATLIRADGSEEDLGCISKVDLARRLAALSEEIWRARNP